MTKKKPKKTVKQPVKSDNWLGNFVDGMELLSKRKEEERQEWLAEIGPPIKEVTVTYDEGITETYGFWKGDGEVVRIRKMKNGYHPSAEVFSVEMIKAMAEVMGVL